MKNSMILAAAAALALAACAKVDTIKNTDQEPISFGVYTTRLTKAVSNTTFGDINTVILGDPNKEGFGVFCYYSDGIANQYVYDDSASPNSNFLPNFMYNQQVKGTSLSDSNGDGVMDTVDGWEYSPLKYWPNEYDNTSAIGADIDKLTFFAYAPYVETVGDEGVTAISAKNATGNPTVEFKVPANKDNQIDLLWSYADTKNMVKPAIGTPVHFNFKHALSNLSIIPVAVVDAKTTIPASSGTDIDAATTVTINSITVTGKFDQEGTLDIATGEWTSSAAATAQTVTYAPATAFDVTNINDKAEADAYVDAHPGELPQFMFIPSSNAEDYVITIDYDFTTADSKLDGGEAVVHNVIHKTLADITFLQGKKMKLYLGLGITSVVVDAVVGNWEDGGTQNVWLPVNL